MNEEFLSLDPREGPTLDKTVVLILGPEKSGTKLTTRCFVETMGCFGDEKIDGTIIDGKDPLVVRFDLPTTNSSNNDSAAYVQMQHLTQHFKSKGFNVKVLITTRDVKSNAEAIKNYYNENKKYVGLDDNYRFNINPNEHLIEDGDSVMDDKMSIKIIQSAYSEIFKGIIVEDLPFCFSNYEELLNNTEQHLRSLAQFFELEFTGVENLSIEPENKETCNVE